MGRFLRCGGRRPGRAAAAVTAFLFLSLLGGGTVFAEEPPAPQLPVLLMNGAIYPQSFNAGALPADFRLGAYPHEAAALHVLHCGRTIKETWVEEVERIGGELRGYLPYNSLLVGMDGEARSRLGELDFIDWSGPYQPYYKISPALQLRLAQGGEASVLAELWSPRLLEETLDELSGMPVEVTGAEADPWCAVIALRMGMERLEEVAALPAVEWMELSTSGTLTGALTGAAASPVSTAGTPAPPLAGGERVGLGDTGLGTGGLPGVPPLLQGRVLTLDSYRGDDGADANGHGTAVAGVLAGAREAYGGSGTLNPCQLVVYATGYGLGGPPAPLSLYSMLGSGYGRGVRLFLSGSVPEGRESLGAYGLHASQRDAFVWANPSMALIEAAGNEGTDSDGDGAVDMGSLLGGATAKNVLSVGGSESPSADDPRAAPLTYGELQDSFLGRFASPPLQDDPSVGTPTGLAAFSSRGPTRDGRIKPDLVVPATAVPSIASGGALGAKGIFPAADPAWVVAHGTGMAAAAAAAGLATMRTALVQGGDDEPSAALLKAFAVNGAVELAPGQYGTEDPEIEPAPNAAEGWGQLDTEAFEREGSRLKVLDDREGLRLEESRAFRVEVRSGSELRLTLAWSDYPSLPAARLNLVNDLDLRVIDPEGGIHYPNGRSSRDPLNNVERIVLDITGKYGDYTIELYAWNVPISPQPFALVAQAL